MSQPSSTWDHFLEHAALSDVGLRRANNQDSMAILPAGSREKWLSRGHLFIVADGMGAHAAGELASKMATDMVPLAYHKLLDVSPPEALRTAIQDTNSRIHSRGEANEEFRGMGTTVDALVLLPQGALVAHVGDSRTYRWRNNRLEQLTFDHSLVWEMRALGDFHNDVVPDYIPRNVITRSMGPKAEVQIDLEGPFPTEVGDTFLLCSDGLTGPVADEEIGKILATLPPEEAARALVDLANLRGGPDNITVIIVRITEGPTIDDRGTVAKVSTKKTTPQPVPSLVWWVLLAILFALATVVGLVAEDLGVGVLIAAVGAVLIGMFALLLRSESGSKDEGLGIEPLGKGPYTAFDTTPDADFVTTLAGLAEELRDAAAGAKWAVDWDGFNAHQDQAAAAAAAEDYASAIRHYSQALSFMVSQLKAQHEREMSDGSEDSIFP